MHSAEYKTMVCKFNVFVPICFRWRMAGAGTVEENIFIWAAYAASDKKNPIFNGQQVGTAEWKMSRREEQFQLTYAKVKVISVDEEQDKQKKGESFCLSLSSTARGWGGAEEGPFSTDCGANARDDIYVIHSSFP